MQFTVFTNGEISHTPVGVSDWSGIDVVSIVKPDWIAKKRIHDSGTPYLNLRFARELCMVALPGLKPTIMPSRSASSDAIYIGYRKDGYLLQFLPPDSQTSKHYHTYKTEVYHNLEGVCNLSVDGMDVRLKRGTYQVDPRVVHQVTTGDEPALTLLHILGDPKGLTMDDHHYV